ncbi:MAG: hypothetical protein WBV82_04955 [Myxococcaceae bacterium]
MKSSFSRHAYSRTACAVMLLAAAAGCGEGAVDSVEPGAPELLESSAELSVMTPLARSQNLATEIVVDGMSVYWVEIPFGSDGKSRIMKRSKSAMSMSLPQQVAAEEGSIFHLTADASNLYWLSQTYADAQFHVTVHRVSKYGGVVTTLPGFPSQPYALTTDDSHFYVAAGNQIQRVSKWTGARQVVVDLEDAAYINLLVDATHVYWLNYRGIFRAPRSGGTPTQLVTETPHAFVLSGNDLYYVPFNSTDLKRVSKAGGTATTVLSDFRPSSQWYSRSPELPFVVSGSDVIWLDAYGSSEGDQGRVLKASLLTGTTQVIAADLSGLTNLAVDASYVYWTSLGTFTHIWPPEHNRDGAILKALR